jgi:RNA polymerase sigma-70 factor (ECF subfamily)
MIRPYVLCRLFGDSAHLDRPPTILRVASDSGTVAALRAGDEDAFRTIVATLNPGLTRLARTYVTQAIAEDVVQETWASVIKSIDAFEERSSLTT